MKIQFVCSGNTFRSRLAEAYLRSKNIPGLVVSSSGIEADKNLNGLVCDYTVYVLKNNNLDQFLTKNWTKTNLEDIEQQDLVVFMSDNHYQYCKDVLHCRILNYKIWNINDVPTDLLTEPRDMLKINNFAKQNFELIKIKVDSIINT